MSVEHINVSVSTPEEENDLSRVTGTGAPPGGGGPKSPKTWGYATAAKKEAARDPFFNPKAAASGQMLPKSGNRPGNYRGAMPSSVSIAATPEAVAKPAAGSSYVTIAKTWETPPTAQADTHAKIGTTIANLDSTKPLASKLMTMRGGM